METKEIIEWINKVIVESRTPEMIRLRNESKMMYIDTMIKKFELFYESYSHVFAKVCFPLTDTDKKLLGQMLATNDLLRNKKMSTKRGEYLLGEQLAKNYAPDLLDPNRVMPD